MSVHLLLLHYRTFEKELLLLAAIREFDDIDTDQFQAHSSRQSRRAGVVVKSSVFCSRPAPPIAACQRPGAWSSVL